MAARADSGTSRARSRGPAQVVQPGQSAPGGEACGDLRGHFTAHAAAHGAEQPAAVSGAEHPSGGPTGQPAQGGHAELAHVEAVAAAGRVLVRLNAEVDRGLFERFLDAFFHQLAAQPPQPSLRQEPPARQLGCLLERGLDGLLAELRHEPFENLLNGDPSRRDDPGRGGRGGAHGQRHRDGEGEQLGDEDGELDPSLDLGGLDIAAGLLTDLAELVGHRQQDNQGGVIALGHLGPRVAEGFGSEAG